MSYKPRYGTANSLFTEQALRDKDITVHENVDEEEEYGIPNSTKVAVNHGSSKHPSHRRRHSMVDNMSMYDNVYGTNDDSMLGNDLYSEIYGSGD